MGRGPSDVGYAVRSYASPKGAHLCDVVCVDNSLATYIGCYVLNAQGLRIGAPTEPWSGKIDPVVHPLVVILHRYSGMTPIVIGRLDNASITFTNQPQTTGYDADLDDTPNNVTTDDTVVANQGTAIVLKGDKEGGDIVVSPRRRLSVQLPESGSLRVSNGSATPDGPVLAGRYAARDTAVVEALNAVQSWLRQLTISTATGALTTTHPYTGLSVPEIDADDVRSPLIRLPAAPVSGQQDTESDS